MRPPVLLVFQTSFEECAHMLRGVARYSRTHQRWAAFLDDEGRAERDLEWLASRRWRGVISRHTGGQLAGYCREHRIPLVDLNDTPRIPGVPKIRPDNVVIGHLGAEHFLERGFRNFAFCGFSSDGWSCERRDGFLEALRLAGRDAEVLDEPYPGALSPEWETRQIRKIARWLKALPKPVAVMACNDMRALEVIEAARTVNLLVPEEVAILGANNDAIRCDIAYPQLSSVAPNPFESGFTAAELLDRMMRGEAVGEPDIRIEPVGVVTRHSTEILAIEDKQVAAALGIIRNRATEGLSVDEVVRGANASRSLLEKKFRRYIGRSPQAEIRRVQMEHVKQLLLETDYPLKAIAALAGFEHMEYMCVVFKRLHGESPGQFRKRAQNAGVGGASGARS